MYRVRVVLQEKSEVNRDADCSDIIKNFILHEHKESWWIKIEQEILARGTDFRSIFQRRQAIRFSRSRLVFFTDEYAKLGHVLSTHFCVEALGRWWVFDTSNDTRYSSIGKQDIAPPTPMIRGLPVEGFSRNGITEKTQILYKPGQKNVRAACVCVSLYYSCKIFVLAKVSERRLVRGFYFMAPVQTCWFLLWGPLVCLGSFFRT